MAKGLGIVGEVFTTIAIGVTVSRGFFGKIVTINLGKR
jgi:hypothetical protein